MHELESNEIAEIAGGKLFGALVGGVLGGAIGLALSPVGAWALATFSAGLFSDIEDRVNK